MQLVKRQVVIIPHHRLTDTHIFKLVCVCMCVCVCVNVCVCH